LEKGYGIDKLKEWVSYKDKSLAALSDKYQVLQSAEKQVDELMA
jgi:acetone carboxylase gamma subunit